MFVSKSDFISKLNDSDKIIKDIEEYYHFVTPIVENNTKKYKLVEEKLKRIYSYHTLLHNSLDKLYADKIDIEDKIILLFNLYVENKIYYNMVEELIYFYSEPELQDEASMNNNISQTYKMEAINYLNNILIDYKAFTKEYSEIDKSLIVNINKTILEFMFEITDVKNIIWCVDNIREIYYSKGVANSITLYVDLLQRILDKIEGKSSYYLLYYYIIDIVERDKDLSLHEVESKLKSKGKKIHINNPFLKQFGFIPITDTLPILDIISLVFDLKIKSEKDISKILKKNDYCLIIIYKITDNPINYDVRNLIIPELAKKFNTGLGTGINQDFIDKFSNIIPVETNNKKSKWDFNIEVVGEIDNDKKYAVIETIDGTNFRGMHLWMPIVHNTYHLLSEYHIHDFIQYVTGINKSTRVSNYQTACIKQAIPLMFLPRQIDSDIVKFQSLDVDITFVKNDVYIKLVNTISSLLDSVFKSDKSIQNINDMSKLVCHDLIKTTFSNSVYTSYNLFMQSLSNGDDSIHREIITTFLSKLYSTTNTFILDLHNECMISNESIPLELYTKTGSDKKEAIHSIVDKIILTCIENILNNDENIFTTIHYKYLLFNRI